MSIGTTTMCVAVSVRRAEIGSMPGCGLRTLPRKLTSLLRYVPGLGTPNNSKPLMASECCSCVSGRYPSNQANCLRGSTNTSDGRPFVTGTFSWTLNDYYGEARGVGVSYPSYGVSSEQVYR